MNHKALPKLAEGANMDPNLVFLTTQGIGSAVAERPTSRSVEKVSAQSFSADLFPESQVFLLGEDPEQYSRITQQIVESVDPTDIIEHFWVRDIADLIWETLRLRRLKGNLLKVVSRKGLKRVLGDAVGILYIDDLIDSWSIGDADARQSVDQLLKSMNLTVDAVYAEALAARVSEIERIDRLIASAESRRNAVLREISRHRDAVAARLVRASAAIEDAEFAEVPETNEQQPVLNGEHT